MELQQKAVVLVTVVLIALAVYFVFAEQPPVEEPEDTKEAENLLFKGISLGKGEDEYVYSYREIFDGYINTYTITKKDERGIVEIENPLSVKKLYFLENDTILCIDYAGKSVCSSVKGQKELENYVSSMEVKFLNDTRIEKDKANMQLMLSRGYAIMDPEIVHEEKCDRINYQLDFSGISLQEAALFRISSSSPRIFNFTMCVDNETGQMHERTFTYEYQNAVHISSYELISFRTTAPGIEAPANVTTGAIVVLEDEREQYVKLANCYTENQGEDRDKCISVLALSLKRTDLCGLAGERKDRCLVSIVPLTKDENICSMISDEGYKDDCYIELAGAYKDESYCSSLQNQSKMDLCREAATPPPPPEPENETEDDFELDVEEFLEIVETWEDKPENDTNTTNETG